MKFKIRFEKSSGVRDITNSKFSKVKTTQSLSFDQFLSYLVVIYRQLSLSKVVSRNLKVISKNSIRCNRFRPSQEFNGLNLLEYIDQPNLAHPTHSIKV